MDFIDYAVFYYLSEQDQQNFLNSLSFFDRQNYQNNYDQYNNQNRYRNNR